MLPVYVECDGRDVTLVLDSSSTVSPSDWSKLMTFVGRLVDELRRRDVVRRLAVVTYTGRVHVALPLDDHHLDVITSLPFIVGHGRNVSGALRVTRTQVQVQFHHRPLLRLYSDTFGGGGTSSPKLWDFDSQFQKSV